MMQVTKGATVLARKLLFIWSADRYCVFRFSIVKWVLFFVKLIGTVKYRFQGFENYIEIVRK